MKEEMLFGYKIYIFFRMVALLTALPTLELLCQPLLRIDGVRPNDIVLTTNSRSLQQSPRSSTQVTSGDPKSAIILHAQYIVAGNANNATTPGDTTAAPELSV